MIQFVIMLFQYLANRETKFVKRELYVATKRLTKNKYI